ERPAERPWPPGRWILSYRGWVSVFTARSFATHFAGSQYMTCESLNEVVTSIHGYALAATLSYGEYCRIYAYCSGIRGLPHCSHSCAVSGSDASSIVLITSTNGTSATTARNRSGRMLTTAPIKSPPALPPFATRRSGFVYPRRHRPSATSR